VRTLNTITDICTTGNAHRLRFMPMSL
jgi:hypothetical protein